LFSPLPALIDAGRAHLALAVNSGMVLLDGSIGDRIWAGSVGNHLYLFTLEGGG